MGNKALDKSKGGMPRMQKSKEQHQEGGARGLHGDSSSGHQNNEDEME